MKPAKNAEHVFVAMSGGVDSSVAALLLVRAGFRVTGVYMRPWQPPGIPCLWEAERADALRVATKLGIPLETWDVTRDYAADVARPMIAAYRRGLTPNPDVDCNRHIKFGVFYDRAMKRGASFVATGHYARIIRSRKHALLGRAADADKDQTYFLWKLRAAQLPHILFPVGALRKAAVRALARRAGLHTATKKDSQGVCFVGPMDMKSFLARAIRRKPGVVRHADGRTIGTHDGAGYYTVGQRHGLDIRDGGGPYYVVAKDMRRNVITVGPVEMLDRMSARVTAMHWFGPKPGPRTALTARIRHRGSLVPARISGSTVSFRKPVSAVASGQSVVLYRGTKLVGGAVFR